MSTQVSSPQGPKQSFNVYTMMLVISTVALLIAVIAMFIELGRYAPDYYNTTSGRPSVSSHSVQAAVDQWGRFG